jgi:hypothetical protein
MLQEIAEHQGLPTEKYRFLLKACPPFLVGLSAISLAEMKLLKTIRSRGSKACAFMRIWRFRER